ncbi:thap-type zinc finger [Holotrichia oblita]|uniref:Thap-type zinc finger n=1 Tax=Holotrichia oblita TaxID=644536 RepID=A0ACB9STY8_HOLOL|nr:thap-type zinc finger [Holotrichia oblita]
MRSRRYYGQLLIISYHEPATEWKHIHVVHDYGWTAGTCRCSTSQDIHSIDDDELSGQEESVDVTINMVHVCCVRGCEDKQSTRHRFPNPRKNTFLYNTWLTLAGNESLLTKNPEDVYKNHRVCYIHFRKEDISSNMYFKKDTFPSLFLPRESTTERPEGNSNICTNTLDKILKHRYSACIEYEEHYYCKPFIGQTVSSPSTSGDSTARTVNVVDKPSTSKEIPHAEVREFESFADNGFGVIDTGIADHVLVFIIRGITRRWKQPIFFSFSHGPSSSQKLKSLITEVIRRCIAAGLNVMATICDQGAPNVSAINSLASPTDPNRKIFFVDGRKIIHLYDPPHLLKGIRNNLLKSNLVWIKGARRLVAMWEDIYNAYKIDNGSGQLRAMPKLTEGHVNPHKFRKMKVFCASQVFSHNVASVMALMARVELTGLDGMKMRSNASDTAETLQFFVELFDSVNGMREWPEREKSTSV